MKVSKYAILKHLSFMIFLTAILTVGISYPFLRGDYDQLAIPISPMLQVFGLAGLLLVPIGVLWAIFPKYRFGFAIASIAVGSFVILIICLFATLSVGKTLGVLTILLWAFIVVLLIPQVKRLREQAFRKFNWLPYYLISLPVFNLLLQIALAKPLTQSSRSLSITNAEHFIQEIEIYRTQKGYYPLTLQAQNKDYYPDVVGIEKYLYAPHKKGYNLSFEQPRFLLDRLGTREWVVYNPLDENSVYSHTAWLLTTERPELSQGWYASGSTGHKHWMYFLFD